MRQEIDDTDRLLSDLAKNMFSPSPDDMPDSVSNRKLRIQLFFTLILYGYAVILPLSFTSFFVLGIALVIISILSSTKHYLLFEAFSIELKDQDINYKKFTAYQTLINTFSLSFVVAICVLFVGLISDFSFSPITVITILSLTGIAYSFFSDFTLISLGFGMSMFSLTTGLISPYKNIVNANQVSTHTGRKVALYRYIYLIIQLMLIKQGFLSIALIIPLPYAMFMYIRELEHSSKLFMVIRGRMKELVPGAIDDFQQEGLGILRNPVEQPLKARPLRPFKVKASTGYSSRPIANVGMTEKVEMNYNNGLDDREFAARTLQRIIDKVKNEGPLQPRGRVYYCINCGSPMHENTAICSACNSR